MIYILSALDNDNISVLLLDLSAAIDTIDHQILLSRLTLFLAFSLLHSNGFSHISQTDISPLLSITRILHHDSSRTLCLKAQYWGPFSSSCILHLSHSPYFELKRIRSARLSLKMQPRLLLLPIIFILSRLDYCNCLLMGTPNSVIQPLQKIHNFAARLVFFAPRHHHSTPHLEKLHWLPISERIKYKVSCMCFNAINESGPAYLSQLLHVYTPSRTLRSSSDTRTLKIQQYKLRLMAFALSLALDSHIWNSLPQDLRHCPTLSSFKAKLKPFLFSQCFFPS